MSLVVPALSVYKYWESFSHSFSTTVFVSMRSSIDSSSILYSSACAGADATFTNDESLPSDMLIYLRSKAAPVETDICFGLVLF